MRRFLKIACFGMLLFTIFAPSVGAQNCVLKVGAWEAYPEEKSDDGRVRVFHRKATITGFASTATNKTTKRVFKGVSLMGYAWYENLPEGNYSIVVRKEGFKTSIVPHKFSCADAVADILVFRGNSSQTVKTEETEAINRTPIPDRHAVLGNSENSRAKEPRANNQISGGILNGKALSLPVPTYPRAAKAVRADGSVIVQVLIDKTGNVISATALSGHSLLRGAATAAARQAKFSPTLLEGSPVKVSGVITYKFVAPPLKQEEKF